MKSSIFGYSSTGLPIPEFSFGRTGARVLILGGVHGDEPEGVEASWGLIDLWSKAFHYELRVSVVPMFNIDGVLRKNRLNARGVDLNRNLPTNDWTSEWTNPRYNPGPNPLSEIENRHLISWLEKSETAMIFSLHSWEPVLNVNGSCLREAQVISALTGYEIKDSIGYPTPGCLGTYCGLERAIPTLTYEIERGLATERILTVHVPAIAEALKMTEQSKRQSL